MQSTYKGNNLLLKVKFFSFGEDTFSQWIWSKCKQEVTKSAFDWKNVGNVSNISSPLNFFITELVVSKNNWAKVYIKYT